MTRSEEDSLGEKDVPEDAYYGIHTVRSIENFTGAGNTMPRAIIHAMVQLKIACARANVALGMLDKAKGEAIADAGQAILDGDYDDQFPVDVFQAGSGTSSHMNVNEVLANVACVQLGGKCADRDLVHPNDDVNKGQSTNNVFPSAIRVAMVQESPRLLNTLAGLVDALREKGREFSGVIKSGRTHLQDAVPVTLGQEFDAYAAAIEKDIVRVRDARKDLFRLGVGGNAIGTGVNTPKEFRERVVWELRTLTDEPFEVAADGLEATQFLTDQLQMSAVLKLLALDLLKITNDLRLLSSGPRIGLGEINLPAVEPGSSIMPGKINPSMCEAVNMAAMQVVGLDHAVGLAGGAGQLELNTHMPLVAFNLVKELEMLTASCAMLTERCISGITANEDVCLRNFENSAGLATVLNPQLGYDRVAELVKESVASGKTIKELVLEKNILSEAEWTQLVKSSTRPNL